MGFGVATVNRFEKKSRDLEWFWAIWRGEGDLMLLSGGQKGRLERNVPKSSQSFLHCPARHVCAQGRIDETA